MSESRSISNAAKHICKLLALWLQMFVAKTWQTSPTLCSAGSHRNLPIYQELVKNGYKVIHQHVLHQTATFAYVENESYVIYKNLVHKQEFIAIFVQNCPALKNLKGLELGVFLQNSKPTSRYRIKKFLISNLQISIRGERLEWWAQSFGRRLTRHNSAAFK